MEICSRNKPRIILLENVSNLISLHGGEIIRTIEKLFTDIGYSVTYAKLNFSQLWSTTIKGKSFYRLYLSHKNIDFSRISTMERKFLRDIIDYEDKRTDIPLELAEKLLKIHRNNKIFGYTLQDKRGGNTNIHSWDLGMNGEISKSECLLINQIVTERRKKHWATKKNIKWMDGMPFDFGRYTNIL